MVHTHSSTVSQRVRWVSELLCAGNLRHPFLKNEERTTFLDCTHLQLTARLCVQFQFSATICLLTNFGEKASRGK